MANFTDTFNRANGGLGANWTSTYNGGLSIDSNIAVSSTDNTSTGSRCTTTFANDQRAQVILALGGSNVYVSAMCRYSGTDTTRAGYQATTNGADWYLTRVQSGSGTDIATGVGSNAFINGDTIGVEAIGTTIKIYRIRSGTRTDLGSVTDSNISSGGCGIEIYDILSPASGANEFYAEDTGGSSDTPLVVTEASLTLAGQDVTLTAGNNLSVAVDTASLTIAGQDVTLIAEAHVTIPVTNASLSTNGQDILFALESPWTEGVIALTGSEITLTATGSITLTVDEAALTLTGSDVGVLADFDFTITVDNGALTLTGQDVSFSTTGNILLPVDAGLLTLTGTDVGVNASFTITGTGAPRRKRYRGIRRILSFGR